jgi:predicted phage baseplate assembly protein
MRLLLPDSRLIGAPANDPRANLLAGVGNAPPRLDIPQDDARLVAWLRLSPEPGTTVTRLRLSWAGINAVDLRQVEAQPARVIGVSDGGSDQAFDLALDGRGSVVSETFDVAVDDPIAERLPWVAVDDIARFGPLDNVYQLDAEAGTVRFGDGVHGRVPSAGSRVIARGRRDHHPDPRGFSVGGGLRGNLPPGSISRLAATIDPVTGTRAPLSGTVKVRQRLATRGGADAETTAQAEKRIPAVLVHRDRAVTAADYRAIARETPGAEVGRVEVLPRFKPQERQGDIPGVVSVMVLPARASVDFAAPYPRADRPLIEAVHAYLDARRPLATELYVIGCEYRSLGVSVAVQLRDGFTREQVLADVRQAIRRWLWPLPLGIDGSDGDWPANANSGGGFPLGRSLTDRELEVVVARVAGVAGVSPVRLFELRDGSYVELPGAGKAVTTLALEAWQLPELTALMVAEGLEAPAALASPPDPSRDVHVPILPELC